ncbi:MAG: Type 1 glutamine amidotransferase-like domain-containing protein [Candidatus Limnocylindrales bacterium]
MLHAARPLLEAAASDHVAYISAASLSDHHLDLNHEQWAGVGSIHHLDVERVTVAEAEEELRRAALVYVPGGNSFVLAHRLRRAGLLDVLREHLLGGLPYIGVSAGAVICGQDVLLSNDVNAPALTEFEGLRLVPFSLDVHYPSDDAGRLERDERIGEYGAFHSTPVLAMADSAELRVAEEVVTLVEGSAHLFLPGRPEPVHLTAGHVFGPAEEARV